MADEGGAVAAPPAPADVEPPAAPDDAGGPAAAGDSDKGDKSGKEAKSKKSGKEAKGKKGKGKKSDGDDAPDGSSGMSLAAHPRAAQRVSEAKSWGALGGFLAGGYLSLSSHTVLDAGVRALAAGAACYVIVWGAAVFVWRRLLVAELRNAEHELVAARLRKRLPAAGNGHGDGGGAGAASP